MGELFAAIDAPASVWQFIIIGLVTGALYALIALGYTMVYGIIELINFAHGDLFMLGSFLALQVAVTLGAATADDGAIGMVAIALMLVTAPLFCAGLNVAVDRIVYRPLRNAPKLAPLVSAIGVSFIFMNIGLFWRGATDVNFPNLIPPTNLLEGTGLRFTAKDAMVIGVTVPTMVALTVFVRYTSLGKAMRATAQNPTAAQLMGIGVDRVIALTFALGGALAGIASVVYGLYNNTVSYQMGFQNGLYAFTAAVLGGIGNIPGAVLGGLVIGLVKALGDAYVGAQWSEALVFAILIVILIFRPTGILGARTREKV
ncbi:branched-chain amino acid ABC transporter permease [Fimbriiglobus ruber]|uniref:High-affinity branched-chain amino acid transport system permease protein LivH n=1 Tax=Fimbriiglobus ruber TaxID=1908690 RepID=A0A225E830_9BACT|nr:branched-chain amino acid ABC transporter permease [Fimbriiglobus ruber]OWK46928.1 High-affinity branched-chain amino acid transport system permease protein LivH [Fimbriiglobus ruber]